jgi:16S rRNA (uracil1498-N3)-methyltransferase
MIRFFIPATQIRGDRVTLEGGDHHHLLNVLRKSAGDEIEILNGKGERYIARIMETHSDHTVAAIVRSTAKQTEPRIAIRLVQSLPKADKFEWILQKNTELGVGEFLPVISERSLIKLDGAARIKKRERWVKIIKEAAEQSGRAVIPQLQPVLEWRELPGAFPSGVVLLPWEGERDRSLKDVLSATAEIPRELSVIIGPEGGFARTEVECLRDLGAVTVTLGPRILRTETAGLVATAAILYHYGELG